MRGQVYRWIGGGSGNGELFCDVDRCCAGQGAAWGGAEVCDPLGAGFGAGRGAAAWRGFGSGLGFGTNLGLGGS